MKAILARKMPAMSVALCAFVASFLYSSNSPNSADHLAPVKEVARRTEGRRIDSPRYSTRELLSINGQDLALRIDEILNLEYWKIFPEIFFIEDHLIGELRNIVSKTNNPTSEAYYLLNKIGDRKDLVESLDLKLTNSFDTAIKACLAEKFNYVSFVEVVGINRELTKAWIRVRFSSGEHLGGGSSLLYFVKDDGFWYLALLSRESTIIGL